MSLFGSHRTVTTPQYTGLQIQSSSSALPIPVLWGMNRVAPNIVWSGAFRTYAHSSRSGGGKGGLFGGGGGSGTTTYDYRTALVLGICEGPASALNTVFYNRGTYAPGSLYLNFLAGTTPQATWGYLPAAFPGQALAYQGTALAVSSSFDLGANASIGSIAFEVTGLLATSAAVNGRDADPALVVLDFLTSAQYGVGFPAASIGAAALLGTSGDASYQSYCRAMGLAFSPCLVDQEPARTILARWLQLTNATAVWSGGLLKIMPFGDAPASGWLASGASVSYQPNVTPVFDLTDDDLLGGSDADPIEVTRSDPYAAANVQRLEILNRAPTTASGITGAAPSYYTPTPVEARDHNAIETTGLRIGTTITAHEICDIAVGAVSAQLILQRGLYVRNTYAFRLSWEYCLLEPMDIVTLTDAGLGLARTPVRITAIEEDAQGLLSVTAEEFPGTIATASAYPVDAGAMPSFDTNVAPAPVNPPLVFEPPPGLSGGVAQIWAAVSGGSGDVADPNWGGANIWISTDGTSFTQIGTIRTPARQGVLTAPLPAAAAGFDGIDALGVDLSRSDGQLVSGSAFDLQNGTTLAIVDAELLAYETATLTAANQYTLTPLRRALFGSQAVAHTSGAPFARLDDALFKYVLPPAYVGVALELKYQSFNMFGGALQDLSTCVAYPYTPSGIGAVGPVVTALEAGTSLDEGLASAGLNASDDYGLASDAYVTIIDMGLASS